MRIRMNTTLMHPRLGAVNPGQVIDLPEEEARALLEGGNVVETFRGDGVICETTPAAALVEATTALSTSPKFDALGALRHLRPR